MAPVAGFVRLRKHQFGRQSVFGTKVAATQAYPFKGVPSVELNWTDPDVDVGSIVTAVAPNRGTADVSASLTAPQLDYNILASMLCAVLGGNVEPTGGGTAKTWTHEPSAVDPLDEFDLFTYEFGDDVTTDWYQLGDGFLESLQITGPEGLGALEASMDWRFGSASSTSSTDSPVTGTVPTPGLAADRNPPLIYMKDLGIYIADSEAGLGASQILNALHTFELTITQEVDEKRWANADQLFDVDDLGRTGYTVELACTFAKTADTVGTGSETDAWFSDDAVQRYIRLKATSTTEAQVGTPYSWQLTMPARYYTREEGESSGNTVIVLNAHAFLDDDEMQGFLESILVNTWDTDDVGNVPS